MEPTKTQINKLGDRIRKGKTREGDEKLLDEFRSSYDEAFETISAEIKQILKPLSGKTTLTNRQTKTSISIKEKLIRLKGRLSEMQDIRGCRMVANDLAICDTVVEKIKKSKLNIVKVDNRNDDIGYRAIHVIVTVKEKPVEIQIRTRLQDIWANICEKYSSKQNDLKYGSRDKKIKSS
ncbi:MAG: hypothetical protein OXH57_02260 [Ekhidna sp.]|nr:hypothetical protein [Ekhidna sp.]